MELYKSEFSLNKGAGKLDKLLLTCDDPEYYKLTNFLYISQNALYKSNIDLVLKFSYLTNIKKEFHFSKTLQLLPNFIRFFCFFECNDNIQNIIKHNNNNISDYKICNFGPDSIGILVMKYYPIGSFENFPWNYNNFHILKNVVKQVLFANIFAFNKFGFVHGDLHTGNVLLKPKRNCIIQYQDKSLVLDKYEAVIMDFEKSKTNEISNNIDLIRSFTKFFSSVADSSKISIRIDFDRNALTKLRRISTNNINFYNQIEIIVDDMQLY